MLHRKKTRSNAPEFLKFRLLLVLAIKLLLGNFYGLMNLLGIKYDHLRCLFQSRISIISKFKCWREIASLKSHPKYATFDKEAILTTFLYKLDTIHLFKCCGL